MLLVLSLRNRIAPSLHELLPPYARRSEIARLDVTVSSNSFRHAGNFERNGKIVFRETLQHFLDARTVFADESTLRATFLCTAERVERGAAQHF